MRNLEKGLMRNRDSIDQWLKKLLNFSYAYNTQTVSI